MNNELERIWKEAYPERKTIRAFAWKDWGKLRKPLRIACLQAEIRNRDLQNMKQEFQRLSVAFRLENLIVV
jgi:hypothetical protein